MDRKRPRNPERHKINTHIRPPKPFKCDFCDYRANTKPKLAEHTRQVHTMERPFKCDQCDHAEVSEKKLKHHKVCYKYQNYQSLIEALGAIPCYRRTQMRPMWFRYLFYQKSTKDRDLRTPLFVLKAPGRHWAELSGDPFIATSQLSIQKNDSNVTFVTTELTTKKKWRNTLCKFIRWKDLLNVTNANMLL